MTNALGIIKNPQLKCAGGPKGEVCRKTRKVKSRGEINNPGFSRNKMLYKKSSKF